MSTTLTDLLERHFLPQVMPDIGADYEGSFRIAIDWLETTVGQPPTLADATPANITAMQHAMADAGMGWSRIRQLKIRIGSLCKHAYRLGLVDHFESVPTIKVVSDSPAYLREVAAADTLAGWYRQHYREPLAERVKESRLCVFDKAVERFDSTFDRHVMLGEVSESMLTQFQLVLKENGAKAFTVRNESNAIRHILQSWNDEVWPTIEQKQKQKQTEPELAESVATTMRDTPVYDFVDDYELCNDINHNSAVQYRQAARSLDKWAGRIVAVGDLTDNLVNAWIRDLSRSDVSPATAFGRRASLLVLWRAARRKRLCDAGPEFIRRVKMPRRAPVAWTDTEVARLIATAAKIPGSYPKAKQSKSSVWLPIIRGAWETALRRGDLLSVVRESIGVDGSVTVVQSKTGSWLRSHIEPETIVLMWHSRLAFAWPYSLEHFRSEFNAIVKSSGLTGPFKKLRRSSASNVEANHPGQGAQHLGHAPGSRIAAKHYFDPTITERGCRMAVTNWSPVNVATEPRRWPAGLRYRPRCATWTTRRVWK